MATDNKTVNYWDKLPQETSKAYSRFCIYRDMGPEERSVPKVQEQLNKATGYIRQLYEWSRKNFWVDRVEAYDFYIAELDRKRFEKSLLRERTYLRRTELRFAHKLFVTAEDILEKIISEGKKDEKIEVEVYDEHGNVRSVVTRPMYDLFFKVHATGENASKISRRSLNLPLSIKNLEVENIAPEQKVLDLSILTSEELAAFKAISEKIDAANRSKDNNATAEQFYSK